jgi:aminoglycoside phosphotransferase (APT) family kinase protein
VTSAALRDEEAAARHRLTTIAPGLPSDGWEHATWIPSNSNDVWRLDDVVLRVCWRGDRHRLTRESVLVDALPESLLAPRLIDTGEHKGLTWQLAHNVAGTMLRDSWLDMDTDELRRLVAQLAAMLRSLHAWTPPAGVLDALSAREAGLGGASGVNLLPLPVPRARELVEQAMRLPHVDAALMRAVERRIVALSDVDPFARDEPRAVVHGDAQPSNLVVASGGIVALLDYEWCRMAPIDTELAIWLHVLRVSQIDAPGRTLPPMLRWLREDYPKLWAAPDLEARLWLYALVFSVQGVLIWEPDVVERDLDPAHHMHALRLLAERPPRELQGLL